MKRINAYALMGHILLLFVLVIGTYSGTFHVPFHFDDRSNIVNNPVIRDLGNFLPDSDMVINDRLGSFHRRSFGFLTFALNYQVNGLAVAGYHVVNICIHVINTLLVYLLTLLMFRTPLLHISAHTSADNWSALLAAVLFAVHPLQTQAVTYIVQRFTSLSTLFYAGAVALYIMSRLTSRGWAKWGLYALSLLFCVIGMKTKEIVFTLPVMLLVFEVVLFTGPWRRLLALLAPFILTMTIIPLEVHFFPSSSGSDSLTVFNIPRLHYLFTESRVLVTYLRLLLLPVNQNLDYDYPVEPSLIALPVIISVTILGLLLAAGIFLIRRAKSADGAVKALAGLGIVWFFLTLSVESTFITLQPMFEHRMYLPMVGVSIALGSSASLYFRRLQGMSRQLFIAVCIMLVMFLAVMAHERNRVWKNEISLWSDITRKAPGNARALISLGSAYFNYGRFGKARQVYGQAGKRFLPFLREFRSISSEEHRRRIQDRGRYSHNAKDYALLQYNLGLLAMRDGRPEDAAGKFEDALRAAPYYTNAGYNLAQVYFQLGRYKEARSTVVQTLEYSPEDQELWALLKQIETALKNGLERK